MRLFSYSFLLWTPLISEVFPLGLWLCQPSVSSPADTLCTPGSVSSYLSSGHRSRGVWSCVQVSAWSLEPLQSHRSLAGLGTCSVLDHRDRPSPECLAFGSYPLQPSASWACLPPLFAVGLAPASIALARLLLLASQPWKMGTGCLPLPFLFLPPGLREVHQV